MTILQHIIYSSNILQITYILSWHCFRYYLKDAVLNGGIPFNKAYDKTIFDYFGTDARFNKVFDNGMSNYSAIIMKKLLENYKGFEGVSTLVDVGGDTGATLNMILSAYPTIKGINFDLPRVIEVAPNYKGKLFFSFLPDTFISVYNIFWGFSFQLKFLIELDP